MQGHSWNLLFLSGKKNHVLFVVLILAPHDLPDVQALLLTLCLHHRVLPVAVHLSQLWGQSQRNRARSQSWS